MELRHNEGEETNMDYKARQATALADLRVQAVRADKLVGEGSCTSIDECLEHDELLQALDEAGVTTPKGAVEWARKDEGLWLEKASDARAGEDDDPQLQALRNWAEEAGL